MYHNSVALYNLHFAQVIRLHFLKLKFHKIFIIKMLKYSVMCKIKLNPFDFTIFRAIGFCLMFIFLNIIFLPHKLGTAVTQWLRCCVTNRKVAGSIPAGVSGYFVDIKSFRSHCGPGVDSTSNSNEYQEYFLGVKTAGA